MATFYVDPNGSDLYNGLAQVGNGAGPWKTIAQVNSVSFTAGDQILFKRGGTWREQLTVPSSGANGNQITFGAYGNGALPIINGSDVLSQIPGDWTNVVSGSTWSQVNKKLSSSDPGASTVAFANPLTNGSIIIVYVMKLAAGISTPTDTAGNNYVDAGPGAVAGAGHYIKCFYALNSHTTASNVITSTGAYWVGASEWTGNVASNPVDAFNSNANATASGTAMTSNAASTNLDGDLVVGMCHELSSNPTKAAAFTGLHDLAGHGNQAEYYVQATAASLAATWTAGQASDGYGALVVAFKVAVLASNLWSIALTIEPKVVLFDDTLGTHVASSALVNSAGKWYWAANVLYVYSTTNPATAFVSPGVEAGQRDYGFLCKKGYVTLQDVHVTGTNAAAVEFANLYADATVIASPQVIRVQLDYNAGYGVVFTTLGTAVTNILCKDSTFNYNGDSGIFVGTWDAAITGVTIQDNILDNNNWAATGIFNPTHGGISVSGVGQGGNDRNTTNAIIQRNVISNSILEPGIWVDTVGTGCIVRYNKCHSNTDGILIEDSDVVQVYYNLAYNNTRIGIQVSRLVHDNLIYNNTVYGNVTGIAVGWAVTPSAGGQTGNIFKNNISYGNISTAFSAQNGGENDGTNGSGNIYLNNCFGPQAVNFITWGAATPDTYAAWETLYGATTTSIQVDPLFVNAAGGNFHLQASSPCVEAGVSVGLTQDYDGNTVEGLPDIGAYELITAGGGGSEGGSGFGGITVSHGIGGRHGVI